MYLSLSASVYSRLVNIFEFNYTSKGGIRKAGLLNPLLTIISRISDTIRFRMQLVLRKMSDWSFDRGVN